MSNKDKTKKQETLEKILKKKVAYKEAIHALKEALNSDNDE